MHLPIQLQENETVVKQIRRHPVYAILKIVGSSVVLAITILILFDIDPDPGLIGSLLELVVAIFGLSSVLGIISFWYRYQNDQWLITNQRLVDSVRAHPFHHQVSTASLHNVQDISIEIHGFMATIFKFGNVLCQTASTEGYFLFKGVAKPNAVMDTINRERNTLR